MTTDFQKESLSFAQKCFDDVRAMSKDTTGVSRQGYGPVETKVLEYSKRSARNSSSKSAPTRPATFG